MENTRSDRKLFIVSFGDSEKYRIYLTGGADPIHEPSSPLVALEKQLNEYLKTQFPDTSFAYYTTPKVTEVMADHEDRYTAYPVLDALAVENIKRVLVEEVKDMNSVRTLDSDAPYSDVNPSAL